MNRFFDTHCHLDDVVFADDLPQVLAEAEAAGVTRILAPGVTWESSQAVVALAERFSSVWAAVAIHPNELTKVSAEWMDEAFFFERFTQLAALPQVCAIGETGLDAYWDDTPMEMQKAFLVRHLELARRTGLPILLHCREAEIPMLEVLQTDFEKRGSVPGVLHSFSGNSNFLQACLELGFFISYSGSVTFTNKKLAPLRETALHVPSEKILIETDAPYLTPMPFRGKVPRNTPAMVPYTAQYLAALRNEPLETFVAQTTANAERLFALSSIE